MWQVMAPKYEIIDFKAIYRLPEEKKIVFLSKRWANALIK